jgi:hypothetical protein
VTVRRFLLPATATDTEARMQLATDLVCKHHRKGLETTGWVLDVYPGERGWIDQIGNSDPKRRVYYAIINTRWRKGTALPTPALPSRVGGKGWKRTPWLRESH